MPLVGPAMFDVNGDWEYIDRLAKFSNSTSSSAGGLETVSG